MAKITIKDVAKEAGVSQSTVSYAINQTRPISEETRQRIYQAIEKTGYIPNINARNLRANKTKMIGIVILDIQKAAFLSFFKHCENYLSEQGNSVILCNLDNDVLTKGKRYIDLLINRGVDGIIVTGMNTLADYVRTKSNIPLIAIRKTPSTSFSTVYCDTIKGSYLAAKYLLNHYHENLHIFTPSLATPTYIDRMSGVFQASGEMGIETSNIFTHICDDNSIESGYNMMEYLIANGNVPHTVFALNDEIAIGALRSCLLHHISIPENVKIIGYDDIPAAMATTPTLASVRSPMDTIGRIAAEALIRSINNADEPIQSICIEPELVTNRGTV